MGNLQLTVANPDLHGIVIRFPVQDFYLLEVEERADDSDLLILGLQRLGRRQKVFGDTVLEIAQRTTVPLLMISRRS